VAETLGRAAYSQLGLNREFERAIAALRHCLLIRNQYAHWIWWDDMTGRIAFANLEQLAKRRQRIVDLGKLRAYHVDAALLMEQEGYFVYTDRLLAWINYEGRTPAGGLYSNPLPKPKRLRKPKLRLEPFPFRLNRNGALVSCFDAFSSANRYPLRWKTL
jgi:hypothetical protein